MVSKKITIKPMPASSQYIVAIGASAGGLEALQDFLSGFEADTQNVSIIIAQHLSPTHKSMLVQLLSKGTSLDVAEAVDGASLTVNTVYITPPDKDISIIDGRICLDKPSQPVGPKPSIDVLFKSLANYDAKHTIGIILSGTGTDGSSSIVSLKKAGGFVMVQNPSTAKYDGMPLAAIHSGHVDIVLSPIDMGVLIKNFITDPFSVRAQIQNGDDGTKGSEKILGLLGKYTGTNFSNYKSATIGRRLKKRMNILQITSYDAYCAYIEHHPDELDELFKTILIGVTSFFRDAESFESLKEALKKILENKSGGSPIRIWVPGCSTGEEAYSIAIILAQLLNNRPERLNIQIFGTDIDEKAITIARKGVYAQSSLQGLDDKIIDSYFIARDNGFELIKSIRSMVMFSRHDLTGNPPFLKMDLISCRNLMIYFNAALQQQILPLFHYSLVHDGFLFLGKSETIGSFTDLFSTFDQKNKIFQKRRSANQSKFNLLNYKNQKPMLIQREESRAEDQSLSNLVRETIFKTFDHPYVIVNEMVDVIEIYGDLRLYMSLAPGSIQVNLFKMVNKELQIELRSIVTKAIKQKVTVKSSIKKFNLFNQTHFVKIIVKPMLYTRNSEELYLIIFEQMEIDERVPSVSSYTQEDVISSRIQDLEAELAATKEQLQNYIEVIETSNEELQSLNEELQSANEELQSTNEELETTNEELQSTNEEVQIAYAELKSTNDELERSEKELQAREENLHALLDNTLQAFILIDTSYRILTHNDLAVEIFNKLGVERLSAGMNLYELIATSNIEAYLTDLREAFRGKKVNGERLQKDQFGQDYWLEYNLTPVVNDDGKAQLVSLGMIDVTEAKLLSLKLSTTEKLLHSVFDSSTTGICITDKDGTFVDVNKEYCRIYGYNKEELVGKSFTSVVTPENRNLMQTIHDEFIQIGKEMPAEWTVQRKDGSLINIYASASLFEYPDGSRYKVTSVRDITENKKYHDLLSETQSTAHVGGWEYDVITHELTFTDETSKIFHIHEKAEHDLAGFIRRFPEEAGLALKDAIHIALEKGDAFDLELVAHTTAEKPIWTRVTCRPIRVHRKTVKLFGTIQDVSAQKANEFRLVANESRYRATFDSTLMAFFVTTSDGRISNANNAACEMFGYTLEEFLTIGREQLIDLDRPGTFELFDEREKTGKVAGEVTAIRKNGEHFPAEISSSVFVGEAGKKFYTTTLNDISNRRSREQHLKLLESVLTLTQNSVIITEAEPMDEPGPVIVYVNDAFTRMTGYTKDEVIGKSPRILQGPASDFDALKLMGEKMRRWESCEIETINYKKNGDEFWNSFRVTPVANNEGYFTHWFAIQNDITDQRNEELQYQLMSDISQAMKSSESLSNSLNQSLKAFERFGVFDLFEVWTMSFDRKKLKLQGKHHTSEQMKLFHEMTSEMTSNELSEGLAGLVWRTKKVENIDIKRNGEYLKRYIQAVETGIVTVFGFPLKYNNEIIGVLILGTSNDSRNHEKFTGIIEKISEHYSSEILHKQLEEEINRIFSAAPDIICVAGMDGYFKRINPAMCELLGFSETELLTNPIVDFVHPDDKEQTSKEINAIKNGVGHENFENRYITKDGRVVWLSWTTKIHFDEGLIYSVAKNITDRKEADEILQEMNRKLEDRAKELATSNAELEQFAYVASHDLQEPLRMITSFLSIIEKKYQNLLDDKGRQYIHFAIDGAQRMRTIILDLLEFSRVGRTEAESQVFNLKDVLDEVVILYKALINDSSAELVYGELPTISAVKVSMRQLFQNLIGNALKFRKRDIPPKIVIECEETRTHWKFKVTDNGIGIENAHLDRIFNIFQRLHTKEEYEGSGMGLAICRKIVEYHGGKIWVESEPGVGTTFYFTIRKS